MPSFPPPGSVTICEINRDLITAESLSDDGAKETYGKVLGVVFSPVPFQNDVPLPNAVQGNGGGDRDIVPRATGGWLANLQKIYNDSVKNRLFPPSDVNMLAEVDLQGVSWHQHKHLLAFISGINQVTVRDYEDSDGKDPYILTSDSQKDVKVLDWRPNGGKTLSVACKRGWNLHLVCFIPRQCSICEIWSCLICWHSIQRCRSSMDFSRFSSKPQ